MRNCWKTCLLASSSVLFEQQLLQRADSSQQKQLADWLEKVIVYDNKILSSTYTPLDSGGYEITLQLEAHKMELQADGALTEVP